jgi:hypothetical protein
MHSSETRWAQAANDVATVAAELVYTINRAEEKYQELLEVYGYAGGTTTGFAELLFYGTMDASNTPTTEEVNKATDLRDAMVAAHNVTTTVDLAALRRMS